MQRVIVKAAMALRQMVVDGDQLKLRFEEILALQVKRFADEMLVFGAGSLAGLASAFFCLYQ
jgi:hypothetical protein